jgi:hypothetical protein
LVFFEAPAVDGDGVSTELTTASTAFSLTSESTPKLIASTTLWKKKETRSDGTLLLLLRVTRPSARE